MTTLRVFAALILGVLPALLSGCGGTEPPVPTASPLLGEVVGLGGPPKPFASPLLGLFPPADAPGMSREMTEGADTPLGALSRAGNVKADHLNLFSFDCKTTKDYHVVTCSRTSAQGDPDLYLYSHVDPGYPKGYWHGRPSYLRGSRRYDQLLDWAYVDRRDLDNLRVNVLVYGYGTRDAGFRVQQDPVSKVTGAWSGPRKLPGSTEVEWWLFFGRYDERYRIEVRVTSGAGKAAVNVYQESSDQFIAGSTGGPSVNVQFTCPSSWDGMFVVVSPHQTAAITYKIRYVPLGPVP
ncbi:MAG: hypothetical protein FJX75_12115 [Armatimonadetes bacterium]|nr:hypothetical protein [Armatimonadota bacterium]